MTRTIAASAVLAAAAMYPQKSSADEFTGADFLSWSDAEQRGYVSTQLVMASSIAARIKPPLATCIGEMFFEGSGMSDNGFDQVIARIREFSGYHPSSVMVIVIENACGRFN
ncbi:MAG: hypothetical protein AB8B85_08425 [Paracoccaceae bacterium]